MKKLVYSIGVIGPQGSGKTYLVSEWAKAIPRLIVFDPLHSENTWPGIPVRWNPREAARQSQGKRWKIHYLPLEIEERKGNVPGLDYMASLAWQRGECTLIIEEAHIVLSSHTAPPKFMRLVRVGRNHSVSMIWISHRFVGVHPSLRINASKLIFFRVTEPLDLQEISKRCGEEVKNRVSRLRRNAEGMAPERLEFDTGTGEYKIF